MPSLTATPGTDGERVEQLLTHAISSGSALLRRLATQALRRRLRDGAAGSLFSDAEKLELAARLASATAAADLLGRQRIRRRLLKAISFAESTPFDQDQEWLQQMLAPRAALDWFKARDPSRIDPNLFEMQHEGAAFAMAATTDREVLSRVHDVITERMETGKSVRDTPQAISRILTDAGIESNSAYGEMVFRTNTMEAYRAGAWAEFQSPDVEAFFPCWRYIGVRDGRQRQGPEPSRPDHRIHCGKYWPRTVDFRDVRGRDAKNVIQCVLPGTLVSGRFRAASKAWYSGDAFNIKMASGNIFAVTRNHPVLAENRLVRACEIQNGLKVWSDLGNQKLLANADVKDRPSFAEDVFDSLAAMLVHEPVSRLDFYGDGEFIKGEIDIVRANRDGLLVGDLHERQEVGGVVLEHPLDRLMRVSDLRQPLLRSHSRPLDRFRFAGTSRSDVDLLESLADCSAIDPEMLGEGVLRNLLVDVHGSQRIEGDDLLLAFGKSHALTPLVRRLGIDSELFSDLVDGDAGHEEVADTFGRQDSLERSLFGNAPNRDPFLSESAFDDQISYAKFLSDFRNRFSGHIVLDEVVNVDVFHYEGPVYDFETENGYFAAGSHKGQMAFQKNCRCDFLPINRLEWARLQAKGAKLETWP